MIVDLTYRINQRLEIILRILSNYVHLLGSITYSCVLRRALASVIPTRSVSERQFRRSLTYVSGYDW
jgi:hypothetical protein